MTGKKLVPITREFLKQFYQKFPLDPVPVETRDGYIRQVDACAQAISKLGSQVEELFGMPTPTRIDDCFWRNRQICEELALSFSKLKEGLAGLPDLVATCERCHALLTQCERDVLAVQEHNTASVKEQLKQFIPQDFRGALLERQRVATEARYKKQVDDLVRRGGSIRQKYDLYLAQQWERRQALVQLGECSGMYKAVIKFVAGIPQVLLDFAKEINAKLGPMEEQRIRYGPDLYGITSLGIRLDVCVAAWAEAVAGAAGGAAVAAAAAAGTEAAPEGERHRDLAAVVEPAVRFYCDHMLRVVRFIGDVFQHSPFFVNKEDLGSNPGPGAGSGEPHQQETEGRGGGAAEVVAAGDRHSAGGGLACKAAAAAGLPAAATPAALAAATPAVQPMSSVPEPGTPARRSGELLTADSGRRGGPPAGEACPSSGPLQPPHPQQQRQPELVGDAAAGKPVAQPPLGGSHSHSGKGLLHVNASAAAGRPPRPPALARADTPPPCALLLASASPGGMGLGAHGRSSAPQVGQGRSSWAGESQCQSHASFTSAEDHQPWHRTEELCFAEQVEEEGPAEAEAEGMGAAAGPTAAGPEGVVMVLEEACGRSVGDGAGEGGAHGNGGRAACAAVAGSGGGGAACAGVSGGGVGVAVGGGASGLGGGSMGVSASGGAGGGVAEPARGGSGGDRSGTAGTKRGGVFSRLFGGCFRPARGAATSV